MQWWIIHALSAHPSTYPTYPLTNPHLGVSNHSNGIILELIERIWFCLQIYDLWKHTTHTTHRSQSLASEIMSFNHSPVFLVFFFFFGEHKSFFMGKLIPLFWNSSDVSSLFQSQSGQPYLCLLEAYLLHIPWDLPLVQHLLITWWPALQPSHSLPHTCEQALVGLETGTYCATTHSVRQPGALLTEQYWLSCSPAVWLFDNWHTIHNWQFWTFFWHLTSHLNHLSQVQGYFIYI